MAPLFSSVMRVFLGLVLGVILSTLLCSSLINLVSPVSYPLILWSSWNPMTTIEDEKFFFFFGPGSGISNDVIISTGVIIRSTLRGFIGGGTFRGVSLCSRKPGGLISNISWSTSSKSSFPKSTPKGCLTRYLLRSLNP